MHKFGPNMELKFQKCCFLFLVIMLTSGVSQDINQQLNDTPEIEMMKRSSSSRDVIFMAYKQDSMSGGSYWTTISFNTLTLNKGNGFNRWTNHFFPPKSGVYMFFLRVASYSRSYPAWAAIMHNGKVVSEVSSLAYNSHYYDSAQGTILLNLKRGDAVWAVRKPSSAAYLYSSKSYKFTAFGGFLLY